MTPEEVLTSHKLYGEAYRYCTNCDVEWPCDAVQMARQLAQSAEGLDVERLSRAIARVAEVGPAHYAPEDREDHWESYRAEAEEYAREYALLAHPDSTGARSSLPAKPGEPE